MNLGSAFGTTGCISSELLQAESNSDVSMLAFSKFRPKHKIITEENLDAD